MKATLKFGCLFALAAGGALAMSEASIAMPVDVEAISGNVQRADWIATLDGGVFEFREGRNGVGSSAVLRFG
jgi:hypothetical protein